MSKPTKASGDSASEKGQRLLLHLEPGLRQAVGVEDVYLVEAKADDSVVRLRGAKALRDVRPIEALTEAFAGRGFVRIHRSYLVNVLHVKLVRKRKRGNDWEVVLEPPVNEVLPVSRTALQGLWKALGD
jgi:DNA-binding LytR/AlgR family response regulator